MSVILKSDAVIDPRAMMVFSGYATVTASAMLAAEWFSNHASRAEMVLIEVAIVQ